jgi:signal transduction histidine kinase
MVESVKGQQEVLRLYPNGNGSKIPFRSRIGIKLILGFLIIASITASVGYFSLYYSQTVAEKFHELILQTLPTVDSLKEMKAAALQIETATNEYVFIQGVNGNKYLQEINDQKSKFNNNLNKYEGLLNKYFPDEKFLGLAIRNTGDLFIKDADKLVKIRQTVPFSATLPAMMHQQALTIKNEFEPDKLFSALDNAISHEVVETANRTNAVDTAISNSTLVTISSITISVIFAISFGLYFSRYISGPISNLREAATQIGIGDYVAACKFLSKTHRGDEIGKLSSQIEKMRQNIESMKTNLDKLVDQRTKELEIKNQELFEREKDLDRANQELVKTELAKEEFMSMISHELKTPIAPMRLYTEMLLKSTSSFGNINEKQKKAIQIIFNNILRLEVLVSDLLDVYKLDIGRLKLKKTEIDIEALVNQSVAEFLPLTNDKRIDLVAEVRTSGTINCDSGRISQVISNLVKNSIDFVPQDNGRITIRIEEERTEKEEKQEKDVSISDSTTGTKPSGRGTHKVVFTIEDNGLGIHGDNTDNLFKKFYQIDTTATRKHGGTGLGLAICRGIVEAHGGKIWLDKTYTTGASIKFTLPSDDVIQ